MRIILSGYTGHMGREVRASAERAGYPIVAGVDAMAKEADDICVLSFDDCTAEADVIIDYSHHSMTGKLLDFAEKRNLPAGRSPTVCSRVNSTLSCAALQKCICFEPVRESVFLSSMYSSSAFFRSVMIHARLSSSKL